jgi:hypothetical protein
MIFTLLYLVNTEKVIMEELRQHVYSDRKDTLPCSFMIFIEENSVSFESLWNCRKTGTNKHTKQHPYCCCPERLEELNRQKCFETVATYSRFCVQKFFFTRSRRGLHRFCHISKHAKPLPCGCFKPRPLSCSALKIWRLQKTTQGRKTTSKKVHSLATNLHRHS